MNLLPATAAILATAVLIGGTLFPALPALAQTASEPQPAQPLSDADFRARFTHRFPDSKPQHPRALQQDSALPRRNLRVEVRQTGSTAAADSHYGANARIVLQPGNSGGSIDLHGTDSSGRRSRQFAQQALVLNGHQLRFTIGNTQALRVIQTVYTRHSGIATAPGTVFIQRNSGFYARPTWHGGQSAEVEITAMLDNSDPYRVHRLEQETATATTAVSLPLGQWVTIAESLDRQNDRQRGTLHRSRHSRTDSMQIQMRITPQ